MKRRITLSATIAHFLMVASRAVTSLMADTTTSTFPTPGLILGKNALSLIFHNVPASEVQEHPKRFKGQPFVDMIAFPESNDVGIGSRTAAKLYNDFSKYATKAKNGFQRLAAEAASQKGKRQKRPAKSRSHTANLAYSLTDAIGGMTVGGDDDPECIAWEWKWQLYRDFRRALKLACDDGLVLVSI